MEMASDEMDLDEWEFLSDDGFHHYVDSGKRLSSRETGSDPKSLSDMNNFISPSPSRVLETPENSSSANQLVQVPIRSEQKMRMIPGHESVREISKIPILPSVNLEKFKAPNLGGEAADQDAVSQVFFNSMKENEFVDMKMDSPKSSSRGINPQSEEKEEDYKGEAKEQETSPRVTVEQEILGEKNYLDSNSKEGNNWERGSDGGLSIWRWKLTGIGVLCSIGVTAVTVCIFILGSHQRHKHHQQNQKLQFQTNTGDKEINQALSAVRGVPLTRAHMTFEGYYDGL